MNDRQKGYRRDKAILAAIETHRCLNAEQIQALFFHQLKPGSAKRKAQMRLKRLVERERLFRWRYSLEEPYAYYSGRRMEQIEHLIALNWLAVWLRLRLKAWEELHCFNHEHDYGLLRADAFAVIRNTVTGGIRPLYIELDRAESGNRFDKISLYNSLYETPERYENEWWVPLVKRFPAVLIATTSLRRKTKIEEAIKRENHNGLEFLVYLVNQIREEALTHG